MMAARKKRSRPAPARAARRSMNSAADELRKRREALRRRYKIQDVIQRRQVLLVQVVKEERAQQGRRADHLSVARRPLLRADAQHQPWRRDQPQDLRRRRPQAPEVDHGRPEPAVGDGADRPHRRPVADQGRDQARLRLSRPAVGRDPRAHAEQQRPGPDLPRQRPDQARHPRPLSPRDRRSAGRGRGGLQGRPRLHEAADAEPRPPREAAHRRRRRCSSATASRTSCRRCTSRSSSCSRAAIW